jgi:hypothetical protein
VAVVQSVGIVRLRTKVHGVCLFFDRGDSSSETSVLTTAAQRHIPDDGILYRHRCENLKSYIALIGSELLRRRNVSPVRYEQGSYIPEYGILHSHSLKTSNLT